MRNGAVRLALVTGASAAGGSAFGTAFLVLPLLLIGNPNGDWSPVGLIFAVSLPFTLVGAALLAGLTSLWRGSPSRRFGDYGGIVLAALPIGALMPLPFFGAAGLFFGALFGGLTACVWAALHGRFCLSPDLQEIAHG
jgi:hypothetical protein